MFQLLGFALRPAMRLQWRVCVGITLLCQAHPAGAIVALAPGDTSVMATSVSPAVLPATVAPILANTVAAVVSISASGEISTAKPSAAATTVSAVVALANVNGATEAPADSAKRKQVVRRQGSNASSDTDMGTSLATPLEAESQPAAQVATLNSEQPQTSSPRASSSPAATVVAVTAATDSPLAAALPQGSTAAATTALPAILPTTAVGMASVSSPIQKAEAAAKGLAAAVASEIPSQPVTNIAGSVPQPVQQSVAQPTSFQPNTLPLAVTKSPPASKQQEVPSTVAPLKAASQNGQLQAAPAQPRSEASNAPAGQAQQAAPQKQLQQQERRLMPEQAQELAAPPVSRPLSTQAEQPMQQQQPATKPSPAAPPVTRSPSDATPPSTPVAANQQKIPLGLPLAQWAKGDENATSSEDLPDEKSVQQAIPEAVPNASASKEPEPVKVHAPFLTVFLLGLLAAVLLGTVQILVCFLSGKYKLGTLAEEGMQRFDLYHSQDSSREAYDIATPTGREHGKAAGFPEETSESDGSPEPVADQRLRS